MFVRRTQTRRTEDGKPYFSHRLVYAERLGSTVRQRTLLNLGRHFDMAQAHWPLLCARINEALSGQASLVADCPPAVLSGRVKTAPFVDTANPAISGARDER